MGRYSFKQMLYINSIYLLYNSYTAVMYAAYNFTSCTHSRLMTVGSSADSGRDRQMPWMTREISRRLNK